MSTAFGSLSLFSDNICDPSYQLSRLTCIDRDNVLLCDADQLKCVQVHTTDPLVLDDYLDSGNVARCGSYSLNSVASATAVFDSVSCGSSFQSIRLINQPGQQQAVAVTSHGGLVTCSINKNDSVVNSSYTFGSLSYGSSSAATMGGGYVGLCHTTDRYITSHYLSKSLVWSDMATLAVTRRSSLYRNPNCVVTAPSGPSSGTDTSTSVALVAEGSNIAVYDERQHSKGGCVFRELNEGSCSGQLWDILPLNDQHRVAAAGSEKNIRIYDNRMWKTITKWKAPHKFDVVKLLPCSNNPLQLYVAGRDNEVLLCDLEPHLMSTQVQKVKDRKHIHPPVENPNPTVDTSSATSEDVISNPPSKKRKPNNASSSASEVDSSNFITAQRDASLTGPCPSTELLPMQLPTSSKLRISHHRGVRAESLWAGLDVVLKNGDGNDRLVGLCGRGKLYIADNANLMKLAE